MVRYLDTSKSVTQLSPLEMKLQEKETVFPEFNEN